MDFNEACLHEGNLESLYSCVNFSHLSIESVDGKQHLSVVVLSGLVGFSL